MGTVIMKRKLFFLLITLLFGYGCGGGSTGADPENITGGDFNVIIQLENPNNSKLYGAYVKLDYGGTAVSGVKKAFTISGNPRGGTGWDVAERVLKSGADDKLWWSHSGDGILHLRGEGVNGMVNVQYSFDDGAWSSVEDARFVLYNAPSLDTVFSIDFNVQSMDLPLGVHSVKTRYDKVGGNTEIAAEKFKLLSSEGVEVRPLGVAATNSIVMANDSFFEKASSTSGQGKYFMKIGIINHVGFAGSGDILSLPIKVVGDQKKITIKEFFVNDANGKNIAESSGVKLSIIIKR